MGGSRGLEEEKMRNSTSRRLGFDLAFYFCMHTCTRVEYLELNLERIYQSSEDRNCVFCKVQHGVSHTQRRNHMLSARNRNKPQSLATHLFSHSAIHHRAVPRSLV